MFSKELEDKIAEEYKRHIDQANADGQEYLRQRMRPHIMYKAQIRNAGNAGWCCELKCPDSVGITAYGKSPEEACIEFDRIWRGLPKSAIDATTIKMVKTDDGGYVPEECCTFTNPATTPSGKKEIDDYDVPCFGSCEGDCTNCIIQKIFNHYAMLTGQYDSE